MIMSLGQIPPTVVLLTRPLASAEGFLFSSVPERFVPEVINVSQQRATHVGADCNSVVH